MGRFLTSAGRAGAGGRRSAPGAAIVALVLVSVVGACGGSSDSPGSTSSGGGASDEASASAEAFPVTISHQYGETTIESEPQRVVTVGLTDQDSVLALGVAPVGVTDWFGEHPHATWPWAQDELEAVGAEPEIVGDSSGLNLELVAGAAPDLILAVYAGLTQEEYDTLSEIAPVVAQPADYVDYGVPWDEQTLIIGSALGRADEAEAAVAEVQDAFEEARAAHPEFEGALGMVATPYNDAISVYAPEDVRGRFLASLGFTQPPEIAELAGDQFSADLSPERTDLLEVDALVWIINDADTDIARFDEDPIYSELDVHTGRHEVFVENLSELGGATSFVTVLSLPVLIDELVPQLADAVAGAGQG